MPIVRHFPLQPGRGAIDEVRTSVPYTPTPVRQSAQPSRLRENSPLAVAQEQIVTCDRCRRLREYCQRIATIKKAAHRDDVYWGRPVPGFGDPLARVLILGLAPAAHGANRTGRVFTGDGGGGSGDFLMRALHENGFASAPVSQRRDDGLTLTDAFIAATVRCAPPDNKPTPEEVLACRVHLDAEWDALPRVEIVVTLGRISFDACWARLARRGVLVRPRPPFAHCAEYEARGGPLVIGSYHPSRQNTNTGRLTATMMHDVFALAAARLRRS
jgi:uracil-DNA glycosylase